jgi:hypothetical protein
MSNLYTFLLIVLACLSYLFVWWRGVKEELPANERMSIGFLTLIFMGLGWFGGGLVSRYLPLIPGFLDPRGVGFWAAIISGLVVIYLTTSRLSSNFLIFFEPHIHALYWFAIFISGQHAILFVASLLTYYWSRTSYKSFSWYKSGKFGFASLFSLTIYFATRAVVEFGQISLLSFASLGRFGGLLSVAAVFLLTYSLFLNSRKT